MSAVSSMRWPVVEFSAIAPDVLRNVMLSDCRHQGRSWALRRIFTAAPTLLERSRNDSPPQLMYLFSIAVRGTQEHWGGATKKPCQFSFVSDAGKLFHAGVPIPKFAYPCGTLTCELRN